MEKFTEELNRITENRFDFELKSALLDEAADFCVVEILYKDGSIISAKEKKEIEKFAMNFLPKTYKYKFEFTKKYVSKEKIYGDIIKFLNNNFPSMSGHIESINLDENKCHIQITVDELMRERAKNCGMQKKVVDYLKSQFVNVEFSCDIDFGKIVNEKNDKLKTTIKVDDNNDFYEKRKIDVLDIVPLIGEFEEGIKADYIKDKTNVEEKITICGTIRTIKDKVIKRKQSKDKDTESDSSVQDAVEGESQDDTKYQRKLYRFTLADFTGEINCVIFSNKETQSKLEKLEAGSKIVVSGDLEEDKFFGSNVVKVKKLGYCSFPEIKEEYIEYRQEKPYYEFVEPEKIVTYSQDSLLDFSAEKKVPKYLQGKRFVCFDFETTGLNYSSGDRIIEIGAVEINNGKITEKFLSYVNPERTIPKEASAVSGIVDSDVMGAPTADKVLQDFYKWTRGAILIGYNNINFDNIFLIGQGKQARWNFDNETDDVYRWAQRYVKGAKNYRLKTIAEKLGVALDNAHRAVYDALATAEVFIKINELYENDIKWWK